MSTAMFIFPEVQLFNKNSHLVVFFLRPLESKSENNMTCILCIRIAKTTVLLLPPENNKNALRTSMKDDLFHLDVKWSADIPGFLFLQC